jgi:hypothetical protein
MTLRWGIWRTAGLAVLSAIGVMPVLSTADAAGSDAALAGATVIEAMRPGFVTLHLDRALSITHTDDGRPPEIQINVTRRGRFAAAVLRGSAADADGGRAMVTATITEGGKRTFTEPWSERLPVGDYRLYLAFDEGPVRAEIRIPSREGTTQVQVATPMPLVQGPVPKLAASGSTTRYGRVEAIRGLTLFAWDLVYSFPGGMPGRKESCLYQQPAGDDAFGIGCPGGLSLDDTGRFESSGYDDGAVLARQEVTGIGANFTAVEGEPAVDFYAAWLPLAAWDALSDPSALQAAPSGRTEVSARARRKGRTALLVLRCPGSVACHGTVRFPGGTSRRYSIPPRSRATLRLKVPAAMRRHRRARILLRPDGRRSTRVTVRFTTIG